MSGSGRAVPDISLQRCGPGGQQPRLLHWTSRGKGVCIHLFRSVHINNINISYKLPIPSCLKPLHQSETWSTTSHVKISFICMWINRPFYSCWPSDLTSEWQRGWRWPCFSLRVSSLFGSYARLLNLAWDPNRELARRLTLFWYRPHNFYCANQVVLMLTSKHLHEKSREVFIKARSPPASLAFMAR